MGCGASRLDENGMVIPLKARPLLLFRVEEFKRRRHPQVVTDSRPSQKVMLPEIRGEDDNKFAPIKQTLSRNDGRDPSWLADETGSCVTSESSKGGSPERERFNNHAKAKRDEGEEHEHEGKLIEPLAKDNDRVENEHDDDDEEEEEDNDGRMIGHHADDSAYPGSPSFRVYYTNDIKGDNKIEDVDDLFTKKASIDFHPKPSKPPPVPPLQPQVPMNQEVKKKIKRSFRKVLPRGKQAKNLFNVRAYKSAPSNHDRAHLLTAKAHA